MKDFYIRTASHWVKVTRDTKKTFSFALGYKGEFKAFRVSSYSKTFMPTIADAKDHAKFMIDNEIASYDN